MARTSNPGRIEFRKEWFSLPLMTHGGYDLLLRPRALMRHRHSGFEITFIDKGEAAWVLANGKKMVLRGGDMAVIQPKIEHYGEMQIIKPCSLFWVVIDFKLAGKTQVPPAFESELKKLGSAYKNAGNKVISATEKICSLFQELKNSAVAAERGKTDSFSPLLNRLLILQIVGEGARLFSTTDHINKMLTVSKPAIEYMRKNYRRAFSMPEIAEAVGIGVSRFNDKFKEETGLTPADYLNRLRCDKAMEMLSSGRYSVTETSFSSGFTSSQYFAKVFRKYTGRNPASFIP
ncbi:MAG: AraC family transcriptional regulator [Victivallales bacterium]